MRPLAESPLRKARRDTGQNFITEAGLHRLRNPTGQGSVLDGAVITSRDTRQISRAMLLE